MVFIVVLALMCFYNRPLISISFFFQNAHDDWLTKEYISIWFRVLIVSEAPKLKEGSPRKPRTSKPKHYNIKGFNRIHITHKPLWFHGENNSWHYFYSIVVKPIFVDARQLSNFRYYKQKRYYSKFNAHLTPHRIVLPLRHFVGME